MNSDMLPGIYPIHSFLCSNLSFTLFNIDLPKLVISTSSTCVVLSSPKHNS